MNNNLLKSYINRLHSVVEQAEEDRKNERWGSYPIFIQEINVILNLLADLGKDFPWTKDEFPQINPVPENQLGSDDAFMHERHRPPGWTPTRRVGKGTSAERTKYTEIITKITPFIKRLSDLNSEKKMAGEQPYIIKNEKFGKPKKSNGKKKHRCFVIMPIGDKDTIEYENNMAVFEKIIRPCVLGSGFDIECYHADLIEKTGWISKQIIEALRDDDIVIADLRRDNPNVLYELGIRHTFEKRSILICSDFKENIFHTLGYRAKQYHLDGKSNKPFFNELVPLIKEIIENPEATDNPVRDTLSNLTANLQKAQSKENRYFYINGTKVRHYWVGELHNISGKTLIELDIRLSHNDESGLSSDTIAQVVDPSVNHVLAHPVVCHSMNDGEKKHIMNLPRSTVKIIIQGKEATSLKPFKEEFTLAAKGDSNDAPRITVATIDPDDDT